VSEHNPCKAKEACRPQDRCSYCVGTIERKQRITELEADVQKLKDWHQYTGSKEHIAALEAELAGVREAYTTAVMGLKNIMVQNSASPQGRMATDTIRDAQAPAAKVGRNNK